MYLLFKADESLSKILVFNQEFLVEWGFQMFNTIVLIVILAWLLYKPVLIFLQQRKDRIKKELETAETTLKDAEGMKTQYASRLAKIEIERGEILETARKNAREKETVIIAEAKAEANLIVSRGRLELEREKEKAAEEMKAQMIEISALIAARFVSATIDAGTQKKLLDEAISDLGDVKWTN